MAKDPGRTPATAKPVTLSKTPRTFKNSVSGSDKIDYYSFRLDRTSSFQLRLNGLKANVDVALFNSNLNLIQRSNRPRRRAESINISALGAGTYYLQVLRRSGKTAYQLTLSSDPAVTPPGNKPPTLITNAGVTVQGGGSPVVINNSVLAATDPDGPAPLLYTVTSTPLKGSLQLNGAALGNGGSFTQPEIDAGLVTYTSSADATKTLTTVGSAPQISDSNAVWVAPGGTDQGTDNEIFFYSGVTGKTTQLTTDSFNESAPQISGSSVIWAAPDQTSGGTNTQIFLYDGTTGKTNQLTTDTVSYSSPAVSQNPATGKPEAIWLGFNGNNTDVYLFDGDSTVQLTGDGYNFTDLSGLSLTDSGRNDISLQINGARASWTGIDGDLRNVFFVNPASANSFQNGGKSTKQVFQLSSARTDRSLPVISPSAVVWVDAGSISFFTGGGKVGTIPTSGAAGFPQISASDIVFTGAGGADSGSDTEIFYFNIANFVTPRGRYLPPLQITTNSLDDFSPQISTTTTGTDTKKYVAWTSFDGVDNEVYYYDASRLRPDSTDVITPVRLTNNITDDTFLGVSGSIVFWSGTDLTTRERELFYQDVASGGQVFQTRNDGIDDYAVLTSGSNVLWYDPSGRNSAIFSRTLNRSDSFSFTVADGAGAATGNNTFNIIG
jgi:hypothetical protein